MSSKYGSLELIIGPMYAGKSTELIRIINRYKCLKKNILVIKKRASEGMKELKEILDCPAT